MKIVIDATEPTLDIREAREDEEGFEVPDKSYGSLRFAEQLVRDWQRALVQHVIDSNPDQPDVPYLREYLQESDHAS